MNRFLRICQGKELLVALLLAVWTSPVLSQSVIDVERYRFELHLSDESDLIVGQTVVDLDMLEESQDFALDLYSIDASGKGMRVLEVTENGQDVDFVHSDDKLSISPTKIDRLTSRSFTIKYEGIPADGLIIGKNKYGDRTFFGDNWPNRAYYWLPCVDHSSDKAFVEFLVTAPDAYQVIANGSLVEETSGDGFTFYHWKTDVPIPPKVAVIGVARFAVQNLGEVEGVPLSSWVYPENRDAGFYDYALAEDILSFFSHRIGPYPFAKLANVQSKTRYGGMENAGNIFYSERSVSGERKIEGLFAHEIAHQWFGNSATESDWSHLWLSEGFATYMTNLYLEHRYGESRLDEDLTKQRKRVIDFNQKTPLPVINETKNYMSLLNANSYQKGGWILHMLRTELGLSTFWEVVTTYYHKYRLSNASSSDFQAVVEQVSGKEFDDFFDQWLKIPDNPKLKLDWSDKRNSVNVKIDQLQSATFDLPLELGIYYKDGSTQFENVHLTKKSQSFAFDTGRKIEKIVLDPHINLLFTQ